MPDLKCDLLVKSSKIFMRVAQEPRHSQSSPQEKMPSKPASVHIVSTFKRFPDQNLHPVRVGRIELPVERDGVLQEGAELSHHVQDRNLIQVENI
jgi:hypothetical protein